VPASARHAVTATRAFDPKVALRALLEFGPSRKFDELFVFVARQRRLILETRHPSMELAPTIQTVAD
jgi:hypothetical protein